VGLLMSEGFLGRQQLASWPDSLIMQLPTYTTVGVGIEISIVERLIQSHDRSQSSIPK